MLHEKSARPTQSGFARRWLTDDYFDLIVWYEPAGGIHGFQLCYDKPTREHAFTWTHVRGFTHCAVDGGESSAYSNGTPILVPGDNFPTAPVREQFLNRSSQIDGVIRQLVLTKIDEFAANTKSPA